MDAYTLAHECHENDRVGKGNKNGVEHDLGEDALNDDTQRDHGEDVVEGAPHGFAGRRLVSEIAEQNKEHLCKHGDVSDGVERTAAVIAFAVKIEKNTGRDVDDHRGEIYSKNAGEGNVCRALTVPLVRMFKDLNEKVECDERCRDQIGNKVKGVDKNIEPKGDSGQCQKYAGKKVGYCVKGGHDERRHEHLVGQGHQPQIRLIVKKESEENDHQTDGKIVGNVYHDIPP